MPKVLSASKTVRLGDVVSVKHGYAFSGEFFSDEGHFIVVTPGNFHDLGGFKAKSGKEKFFSGDFDDSYLLDKDDLIVAMTEQTPGLLGSAALVPASGVYLHNQRIGLIEVTDPLVIDKRFLYYLLNTSLVRSQIQATATGTKVRHTAPTRIEEVCALIPPVPAQRDIVRSLKALEDLIENNGQRIELLEKAARLLYQEWFVNFRYPGHEDVALVDSAFGLRPENWSHTTFGAIAETSRATSDPSAIPPFSPVLSLGDLPNRSTTLQEWDSPEAAGSRKTEFKSGDILFAKLDPGGHKAVWASMDGFCSTDILAFRATQPQFASLILSVASSDHFVAVAAKTANGTTHIRVRPDVLLNYPVPLPPALLLDEFDRAVSPMVRLCSHLAATNRCLREVRDLLLPRLVSGDLDVSDLDLNLETVG